MNFPIPFLFSSINQLCLFRNVNSVHFTRYTFSSFSILEVQSYYFTCSPWFLFFRMADQFCLKWNNYQLSLTSAFKHLLEEEDFVDVTLSAEGKSLKAHKVVLSACSTYFRSELLATTEYFQHQQISLTWLPFKGILSFHQKHQDLDFS